MNNNFLQVGQTIQCGSCHPEKFGDCKELRKLYNHDCKCICHSQPPDVSGWSDEHFVVLMPANHGRVRVEYTDPDGNWNILSPDKLLLLKPLLLKVQQETLSRQNLSLVEGVRAMKKEVLNRPYTRMSDEEIYNSALDAVIEIIKPNL